MKKEDQIEISEIYRIDPQTLSVYLQRYVDITPQEYVKRHPGGALGQLRKGE